VSKHSNETVTRTVLYVDGDQSRLQATTLRLEQGGYRVLPAASAQSAMERLSQGSVDMAIIESEVVRGDGFGLLEQMIGGERMAPTVVITSQPEIAAATLQELLPLLQTKAEPRAA
jgi:DNA-binding NtrC family response regulator